jgi:membrane protease YdiL (CAAX protease family)
VSPAAGRPALATSGIVALAAAAAVIAAGVLSPAILALLRAAGAAGANLEDVTLRVLELVAIGLTFALLAVLGGGGRAAWGIPPARRVAPRIAAGLAVGVLSLGPACLVLLALEVRVPNPDVDADLAWWLTVIARAAASAAPVALLEELWFRGGLFTVLERWAGPAIALWGGAAFYAAVHFLDAPDAVTDDAAGVTGAFVILGHATAAVADARNVDAFLALLGAGVALGIVRLRQGHVALAIGIHAGWVLTIKVFKKYTYLVPDAPLRPLAGRYDEVVGWVAAGVLWLLALLLWRRLAPAARRRARAAREPA